MFSFPCSWTYNICMIIMDKFSFVLRAAEIHFCIIYFSSMFHTNAPYTLLLAMLDSFLQLYLLPDWFCSWLVGAPCSSPAARCWDCPVSKNSMGELTDVLFPFVFENNFALWLLVAFFFSCFRALSCLMTVLGWAVPFLMLIETSCLKATAVNGSVSAEPILEISSR